MLTAPALKHWIKTHPWDSLCLAALSLLGLACGLWYRHILADDAMITFRVAENLAHGRGFVFNPGEVVQVTTTPLYALLLAGGTWLAGSAPTAALWLNVGLAALIPPLAYDLGRRLSGWITGLTGALLLAIMPLLVIAFSMESYLYVTLILASMDSYVAKRYRLAGLFIGLTTMLRGDAVLLGAVLLTWDFLANRRLLWRMIIPAIGIPAMWYLFATIYYGSPFPATLQAKTAQGQFNWLGRYFISGFYNFWKDWVKLYSPLFYLFPLLFLLGLIPVLRKERLWLILLLAELLYVLAFEGMRVTFASWYYAPVTPGVALMIGRGVQLVVKTAAGQLPAHRSTLNRAVTGGLLIAVLALLLGTLYPVTRDIVRSHPDWKAQAYPPAARWIAQNTSPTATLATIDIGHLGYWSGRRIIDIVGLAQPDVAAHIATGDFGYAIRQYQPDIILLGALWLTEVQTQPWFEQEYVARHRLQPPGLDEPLTIYTRRDGVKVQTESIPGSRITPLETDFNRQIQLTGYHLPAQATPGQNLPLTLFWEAQTPLDQDLTIFAQLVDAGNNIIAQNDSPPQRGFYRTTTWQPGERIIDPHTLVLGSDVPPGSYRLLVGLYDPQSGARLQILDANGQFRSDHLELALSITNGE